MNTVGKQTRRFTWVMAALLSISIFLAVCPAFAEDTGAAVTAGEIASLKQTISELQTRLADLEKKVQTTEAAQPKAGENAVVAKSKMKFDGYGQIRYTADDASTANDQFLVRRARLNVQATVNQTDLAKIELKLDGKDTGKMAGTKVQVRQYYLEHAMPDAKLRLGRATIPFGYEAQASSAKLWAAERSIVIDKLFPDQVDIGIQYLRSKGTDKPSLALALFNGGPANADDDNGAKDLMATYSVPFKNGGAVVSYYNGVLGTSDDKTNRDRIGAGLKYAWNKLEFMGEYIAGEESGNDVNGWYSQVGLKLPKSSMIFAKYDQYDEDTDTPNDLFKRTTLGWYRDIDASTRLTLAWELRSVDSGYSDFTKYDGNAAFAQWQVSY